jgi:hypothetical protein
MFFISFVRHLEKTLKHLAGLQDVHVPPKKLAHHLLMSDHDEDRFQALQVCTCVCILPSWYLFMAMR